MTAASFRLKYAGAAFLVALLAVSAVAALLIWRHYAETDALGTLAEQAARERLAPELRARAASAMRTFRSARGNDSTASVSPDAAFQ
ncbi:MAG TPA: hypothetical protein VEG26_02960 [Steroidobacteraceae bacterium]|nr:hypothetical protein [Steroidobacteraceae bacterium]